MEVVTRMAPSPTGKFHLGSARTALFNYLWARKNNGKFILRIEDTDKERSKKEYEENILDAFKWLGLDYDEMFRQSDRTEIYKEQIEKLIEAGHAYVSKEEEGESAEVIRFKNPNKVIKFNDEVLGEIEFDTTELGDFVIAKDLENPLYHLTVVVDDGLMNITHVIRGQDHVSNTPRQILILEALGFSRPIYAHIPLILDKNKAKMSKREGAVAITEFRDEGYLKEGLINFMAFLGWNPGDEREVFSLKELISEFSLEKIQKGGAVFNEEKLDWFNREHLQKLPKEVVLTEMRSKLGLADEIIERGYEIFLERIHKFSDLENEDEFGIYKKLTDYEIKNLAWKGSDLSNAKTHLKKVLELIEKGNFESPDSLKESVWPYAEEAGKGDVLWPLRYALSGKDKSPDPFSLLYILGKEESIERIKAAISKI